ncbi:MAG: hypothetical protein IKF80_02040 [Erysipelotrichaceae bacterium]|nr:hypothetical protein [Erysipelotrichaceae bacterium]
MKIRKTKKILIINLIVYILFLLPVSRLDMFKENYSTLSLDTRGYLYLLFLGILIGLLLGYETYFISGRNMAITIFASLVLGTIIPHHVPYDLQGNLHLLFSYTGFAGMMSITYINLLKQNNQYLINMYFLSFFEFAFIYMQYGMVTTVLEIVIMSMVLLFNYLAYKKKCI